MPHMNWTSVLPGRVWGCHQKKAISAEQRPSIPVMRETANAGDGSGHLLLHAGSCFALVTPLQVEKLEIDGLLVPPLPGGEGAAVPDN